MYCSANQPSFEFGKREYGERKKRKPPGKTRTRGIRLLFTFCRLGGEEDFLGGVKDTLLASSSAQNQQLTGGTGGQFSRAGGGGQSSASATANTKRVLPLSTLLQDRMCTRRRQRAAVVDWSITHVGQLEANSLLESRRVGTLCLPCMFACEAQE